MKTVTRIALPAIALSIGAFCSANATAETNRIDIAPNQVPDEQYPDFELDAPTGWGPHAWSDIGPDNGDKVNWHARYDADGDYLSALFPDDAKNLKINDLSSISYYLKSTSEQDNWFLKIYTRTDDVDDKSTWYGERFTVNYSEVPNDGLWRLLSTDGPDSLTTPTPQMLFNNDHGSDDGLTLAQWKTSYGNEFIEMISIQTNSGAGDAGLMDGLVITLNNGNIGEVNFVPEPSSLALLAIGGIAVLRRRRQR